MILRLEECRPIEGVKPEHQVARRLHASFDAAEQALGKALAASGDATAVGVAFKGFLQSTTNYTDGRMDVILAVLASPGLTTFRTFDTFNTEGAKMSYSFGARGATKALALEAAEAEFKKVMAGQPVHALEEDEAREARERAADLVPEAPEGQDFYLSCSGSVSTSDDGTTRSVVGVSISVNAMHVGKVQ